MERFERQRGLSDLHKLLKLMLYILQHTLQTGFLAYDHQDCINATDFMPLHKHIASIFDCSNPVPDVDIVQNYELNTDNAI